MSDPQIIWAALIAASAVVNAPFLLNLLFKGFIMSEAFKAALASLKAIYDAKLTGAQNDLAAAQAQITELQAQLANLDAEATAEVVAATPAA